MKVSISILYLKSCNTMKPTSMGSLKALFIAGLTFQLYQMSKFHQKNYLDFRRNLIATFKAEIVMSS